MKKPQHYILESFSEPEELLSGKSVSPDFSVHKVNAHIHTPYSFSAFTGIEQIFSLAGKEEIRVLGVNDFFTTGAYEEFYQHALDAKIFPLFNIEFIGLSAMDQKNGIRINDPNNPGRIYLSGKGLNFPVAMSTYHEKIVNHVIRESHIQAALMIDKTNDLLERLNSTFRISFEEIRTSLAKELVRERHIAKMIRIKILETIRGEEEQLALLTDLFGGKEPEAGLENIAALEGEIRSNLLKAGGRAFVEENEKAFLSIEQIAEIIYQSGGIPCYPVLLDNKEGKYTEFEENWTDLLDRLEKLNISCIELIPGRNSYPVLKEFVHYFDQNGFVIMFGTEHNTPDLLPLSVSCRNSIPLDDELTTVSYEGACVIAAHQYLRAKGRSGYIDEENSHNARSKKEWFVNLGKAVIDKFITIK